MMMPLNRKGIKFPLGFTKEGCVKRMTLYGKPPKTKFKKLKALVWEV
jgi:hypothetical protein